MPTESHAVLVAVLTLLVAGGITSACTNDDLPAETSRTATMASPPGSASGPSVGSNPPPSAPTEPVRADPGPSGSPSSSGSSGYSMQSLDVEVDGAERLKINDQGRVIGYSSGGFVWDRASGLIPLGEQPRDGRSDSGRSGPPPSDDLFPTSINAHGQVGGSRSPDEDHSEAFLWEPETGVREVDRPDDWAAFDLVALNDVGQFAGTAVNGFVDYYGPSEAYLWDPSTGWTGLGRSSDVHDLNDSGQLLVNISDNEDDESEVGEEHEFAHDDDVPPGVYLWTPGGHPRSIGKGLAGMLNNHGQVAYSTDKSDCCSRQIWLWDPKSGRRTKVAVGDAFDLNDRGLVVGATDGDETYRAFLWDARHGLTDLGVLPGAEWSVAYGTNDRGQVVGSSGTGPWGEEHGSEGSWSHAFVWDARTGMRDLGTPGTTESSEARGDQQLRPDRGLVRISSNRRRSKADSGRMDAAGPVSHALAHRPTRTRRQRTHGDGHRRRNDMVAASLSATPHDERCPSVRNEWSPHSTE